MKIQNLYGIVALGKNGELGLKDGLPWPMIRNDMRWFRLMTTPHPVIVGRKTYSGEKFPKPLKGRDTIVLSSGSDLIKSTDDVLDMCNSNPDTIYWCAGGKSVYESLLPHVSTLLVTKIDKAFESDTKLDLEKTCDLYKTDHLKKHMKIQDLQTDSMIYFNMYSESELPRELDIKAAEFLDGWINNR